MRFLPLLLCFLLLSGAARAGAISARGNAALSGDVLQLEDGRAVCLAGIAAAQEAWAEKARHTLQELAAGGVIALENSATDRYGRTAAQVYATANGKKIWLQGEMLRQGLAFIYPSGSEAQLADMRAIEEKARRAETGVWADPAYADKNAQEKMEEGAFGFVTGKVVDAARVKDRVYLNFGPDWRTDFTVAIAAHDLRAFAAAGIDPLTLKGKTIRVRGWIKHEFGPMIEAAGPAQIEILR